MSDSLPTTAAGASKSNNVNEKCRRGKRASRKKLVDDALDTLDRLISTRENVGVIPKKIKSKSAKTPAISLANGYNDLELFDNAMESLNVLQKKAKPSKSSGAPTASLTNVNDPPDPLISATENVNAIPKKANTFKSSKALATSSTNITNDLEPLISVTDSINVSSEKVESYKSSKALAASSAADKDAVGVLSSAIESLNVTPKKAKSSKSLRVASLATTDDIKPCNQIVSRAATSEIRAAKVKKSKKTERQSKQKISNVASLDCTDHIAVQQLQDHIIPSNEHKQKTAKVAKKHEAENLKEVHSDDTNNGKQKKKISSERSTREEVKADKATSSNKTEEKTKTDDRQAGSTKRVRKSFVDYISLEEARTILHKQHDGQVEYIEGNIRINRRFYKHAYLAIADREQDLLIIGLRDRNRALEGDLVLAKINPEEMWYTSAEGKKQKTGVVMCILEKVHSRKVIGFLKPMSEKNGSIFVLQPRDSRVPLLIIDSATLPRNFKKQPDQFSEALFLAKLTDWSSLPYARGKIQTLVGNIGDLEVETNAILLQNDLDPTPYDEKLTERLPPEDYVPTSADIEGREDWRDKCIFSIDPVTAVDLDDAVSFKRLSNGNFEIGIHIADVTHFLEAFSPLDKAVADRATTIYLVNTVYHMLPKSLCKACSLLPGLDRLAFSVILELTPEAEVVNHRFAKVIMNSCCQMSYEQAQAIIENPSKDWSTDESLVISGKYEPSEICDTVINLYKLSLILRKKRFDSGALRFDQPKIHINLDRTTGLPISYNLEELQDSNRLIEEFMLLANMTVATHLYNKVPQFALLRNHRPPLGLVLQTIQETLQKFGIHLDIKSAGSLQASLIRYDCELASLSKEDQCVSQYRSMVINALCAKAMRPAQYKCSSKVSDENPLHHYALNVPLYTHFTSPIRRYADCVVHRLLYSTISDVPLPEQWSAKLCSTIAANCNKQKNNAKNAQDQSNELYFIFLLDLMGPINTIAIVMDVKDRCVDVILCQIGMILRIYFADIENEVNVEYSTEYSVPTITLQWKNHSITQVINMFSIIPVRIEKHPSAYRLFGVPLPPVQNASST